MCRVWRSIAVTAAQAFYEATKIGDIALAKTLRDYYNNLTMPYTDLHIAQIE